MTENIFTIKTCPKCGNRYSGHPALSREDNETKICPDCGTREALTTIGLSEEEPEKIITAIHQHSRKIQEEVYS